MQPNANGASARTPIRILLLSVAILSGPTRLAHAETITVGTVSELQNAVASANSSGGNKTILLRDGTYTLNDTMYINTPNVIIASQSGVRENVIIQGDAMSSTARVGTVIRVAAGNFQLSGVTLQKSRWHLIQVAGETNADYPIVRNCILRDAYEQLLKVTLDPANPNITSDNGLVENCLFEYSAGIGPQYYIGGIDAHGAKNWVIRNNTFRNIISPSQTVAEFAIHFWDGSANNTIEKNLIINCDRGIGFGLDGAGNSGGIIRNNMIYHAANAGSYSDTAISLAESPDTQIYNNTIYQEHDFPWSVEYRFASTNNVLIVNNLTNKPITSRDSATGAVSNNVLNATSNWFVQTSSGNLHLASSVPGVVGSGRAVLGLSDDFDNQARSISIDIGADQLVIIPTGPAAPTNLRVIATP